MLRRRFLDVLARAGTGGALAVQMGCSKGTPADVEFRISGFTCVTCATGLETLLGREAGVLAVMASYEKGYARILYEPRLLNETAIAEKIRAMGFRAQRLPGGTAA